MRHYTQLAIEQRYQISGLKKSGFNQSRIATDLNIHKSTISRELKRSKGQRGWRPRQPQKRATEHRRGCVNAKKLFMRTGWRLIR
ncbi:MAG: helix-turn-helix domain-containing protein [Chlorobium sp.]|nr:helix-turn-helix domain-containing protein [Chlorobium sp.]